MLCFFSFTGKEGEAMDKIILAALSLVAVVVKEIFEDR